MDATTDSPGVITKPPFIYLAGIAFGGLLNLAVPMPLLPFGYTHLALPVGLACIGFGLLLMVWSVRTFKRTGTNVDVSKPVLKIVTAGPFAYTRNPMYVGMAIVTLGAAIWIDTRWILIALIPALLTIRYGVIEREEKYLEGKFGQVYLDYKKSVRRWL